MAKKSAIMTGKAFNKALKEFSDELDELKQLSRELLPHIRRQSSGPERDQILAFMEDLLADELPPPRPKARSTWDSQDWLAEAEWRKSNARLWRAGGYLDKARQCEADARKAEKEGRRLREQGK